MKMKKAFLMVKNLFKSKRCKNFATELHVKAERLSAWVLRTFTFTCSSVA